MNDDTAASLQQAYDQAVQEFGMYSQEAQQAAQEAITYFYFNPNKRERGAAPVLSNPCPSQT